MKGNTTAAALAQWLLACAMWLFGGSAVAAVIGLTPDPQPLASIRETDNGPDGPRILDPLSMKLLWRLEDLHRASTVHEVFSTTAAYPKPALLSGYWTRAHLEDEGALADVLMRYARAKDQFERHAVAEDARGALEARSRKLREAKRFLVKSGNWGMLDPYDFTLSAFPAQFHARCVRGRENDPAGSLCECQAVANLDDSRKTKKGCLALLNLKPLRIYKVGAEVAPLRYLPFEDPAEAKAFAERMRTSGAKPWFLVERRGDLLRAPGQQWQRDIYGHVPVLVTRLLFVDREGDVIKSFIVPERAVASSGAPIGIGTIPRPPSGVPMGTAPGDDLKETAPRPKPLPPTTPTEDRKAKPVTVTPK